MSRRTDDAGMPSRRAVVRTGAWGLAALGLSGVLGGCRLRLEDDAPALPLLQRRSIPDEALLVQEHRQSLALAARAADASDSGIAGQARVAHTRHAALFGEILLAGGVPQAVFAPTPATATTTRATAPSTAPATTAPGTVTDLGASEADVVSRLPALSGAVAHRPLFVSVAAYQGWVATQLGVTPAWPVDGSLPPEVAATHLESTRAAVYATEVAAAHLPASSRTGALQILAALRVREAGLTRAAGPDAPAPALGYVLPFPVTSADTAGAVLSTTLIRLVERGLDGLDLLPVGSAQVTEIVRLLAEAQHLAVQAGAVAVPMPGLAAT